MRLPTALRRGDGSNNAESDSDLGPVERQYVKAVERHLLHLPAADRERLVSEVVEHLAERPSAEVDYRTLSDDIGPADDYARPISALPPPRNL